MPESSTGHVSVKVALALGRAMYEEGLCQSVREGRISLSKYLKTHLDEETPIDLAFVLEQVLALEVAAVVAVAKDHGEQ